MIVFVDASAIVAIPTDEPARNAFLEIIDQAEAVTSPIALVESALACSRKNGCPMEKASSKLGGNPAQLNLGDCFAYASTIRAKAKLLYKGEDFAQTDIASAVS